MSGVQEYIDYDTRLLERLGLRVKKLHVELQAFAQLADVVIRIAQMECWSPGPRTCAEGYPDGRLANLWCAVCTARHGLSKRYFEVPEDTPCGQCGEIIPMGRPAIYGTDGVLYGNRCDCDLSRPGESQSVAESKPPIRTGRWEPTCDGDMRRVEPETQS